VAGLLMKIYGEGEKNGTTFEFHHSSNNYTLSVPSHTVPTTNVSPFLAAKYTLRPYLQTHLV